MSRSKRSRTAPQHPLERLSPEAREQLACVREPGLFFPDAETAHSQDTKRAKALCGDCPMQQQCREYAVVTKAFGIWGGTSDYQRKQIRSDRYWGTRLPEVA